MNKLEAAELLKKTFNVKVTETGLELSAEGFSLTLKGDGFTHSDIDQAVSKFAKIKDHMAPKTEKVKLSDWLKPGPIALPKAKRKK